MVRDITSPKYNFAWLDCDDVSKEAAVGSFVCSCGHTCIDHDDESVYVTTHGCGREEDEYIECDQCGTKWEAVWKGMQFQER